MDKGDRNRPFADRRRHALEAASADIAYREHPGQTRFQEIRGPGERPIRRGQIVLRQIRPRFDEPFRVESDAAVEPVGVGMAPAMTKTWPMSYVSMFPVWLSRQLTRSR